MWAVTMISLLGIQIFKDVAAFLPSRQVSALFSGISVLNKGSPCSDPSWPTVHQRSRHVAGFQPLPQKELKPNVLQSHAEDRCKHFRLTLKAKDREVLKVESYTWRTTLLNLKNHVSITECTHTLRQCS